MDVSVVGILNLTVIIFTVYIEYLHHLVKFYVHKSDYMFVQNRKKVDAR